MAESINELTSFTMTTYLQDLNGSNLASIDFMLLTQYRDPNGAIINSRVAQDVNGSNGGTFSAGLLTLVMDPADNVLAVTGADEGHTLHLEWGYGNDSTATLTTPFTTVAASNTVTVAHTANGLSVGEHVTFVGAVAIDGLNVNGTWVVATATTNSWTFEHPNQGTAGVSGAGGSPTYFINSTVGREDVLLLIKAFDKVSTE
jgi:hypothetical protein